jgi:deoxyribodipyrimidine photolyase-like uncharacterized protein
MTPSAWEAHDNAYNAVRAYAEALMESGLSSDQERLLTALDAIVQGLAAAITEASRDLILQQAATIATLEKKLRRLAEQSGVAYPE